MLPNFLKLQAELERKRLEMGQLHSKLSEAQAEIMGLKQEQARLRTLLHDTSQVICPPHSACFQQAEKLKCTITNVAKRF